MKSNFAHFLPFLQASVKAFVVLSSDSKNKNQDEMIKELQNYVTKKTGAWMSPRKVSYVLFTQSVDLISISLAK